MSFTRGVSSESYPIFFTTSKLHNEIKEGRRSRLLYLACVCTVVADLCFWLIQKVFSLFKQTKNKEKDPINQRPMHQWPEGDITPEEMYNMFFGKGSSSSRASRQPRPQESQAPKNPPLPSPADMDQQAKEALRMFDQTPLSYVDLRKLRQSSAAQKLIEKIKDAFKKKARELHPDKNGGTKSATERFQHLGSCYAFLRRKDCLDF